MIWFIFAILGAFFDASYYTLIKKNLQNINQYVLSTGIFLTSSIVLFTISIFRGFPEIGSAFYSSVFATGVLNVIAAVLYFKALKITDLSLAMPMTSFTPIFLILTSFLLLREFPTTVGIVGIFLIVIGSYFLNTTKNSTKLFEPIKSIINNRGTLYMLIVAFLFSISSNYDKLVVQNSDPIFSSAIVYLFLGISFLIISSVKAKDELINSKKHIGKFLLVGIILSLVAITINIAFTMQIVPYVISLERLSILFSVLYGGFLFKEKNILRRSIGALIMLSGVILIILF